MRQSQSSVLCRTTKAIAGAVWSKSHFPERFRKCHEIFDRNTILTFSRSLCMCTCVCCVTRCLSSFFFFKILVFKSLQDVARSATGPPVWRHSLSGRWWRGSAGTSATADGVVWRFPGRLPAEVPHAEPEAPVQPGGPGGAAHQRLHHQDLPQPLHPGNPAARKEHKSINIYVLYIWHCCFSQGDRAVRWVPRYRVQ